MYVELYNKLPETVLAIIVGWMLVKQVLSCTPPKARLICVWGLLAVWLMLVLYITIFSRNMGARRAELGIAHSYFKWLVEGSTEAGRVLIMNIVMFLPGGMVLEELFHLSGCDKFIAPLIMLACLSLSIEILQFVFGLGLAEMDDIINNTLGAAAGFFFAYELNKHYGE